VFLAAADGMASGIVKLLEVDFDRTAVAPLIVSRQAQGVVAARSIEIVVTLSAVIGAPAYTRPIAKRRCDGRAISGKQ
jgi:hypothetical protein